MDNGLTPAYYDPEKLKAFLELIRDKDYFHRNLPSRPSSEHKVEGEMIVGGLYPSFDAPGDIFELSVNPVTVDGRQKIQYSYTRVDGAINWTPFECIQYNGWVPDGTAQIATDISYATSVYKSYREYIQGNFTDEALDEKMTELHERFVPRMEELAESYARGLSAGFSGSENEKNLLKKSIYALFNESLYEKSGVSLADFGMAVPDNSSGDLYSMNDILAISSMDLAVTKSLGSLWTDHNREDYPVKFINYAMQAEAVYNTFSVDSSLTDKLEKSFYSHIDSGIDLTNKGNAVTIKRMEALGFSLTPDELAELAPFDKEPILQSVNSLIKDMRSGLSAADALKKTGYFDVFFKKDEYVTKIKDSEGAYVTMSSTAVADRFNDFTDQLSRVSQLTVEGVSWTKRHYIA